MNFSKFFGLGFVVTLITLFITLLVRFLNISDGVANYIVWCGVLITVVIGVRHLGSITFLEAFLTAGIWLMFRALLDLFITAQFLGLSMYSGSQVWFSYLTLVVGVVVFHKKRHVQIRKEIKKHQH